MKRILVIRGGAIGDFVLTLPALKALREAYPDGHIEILGYKHIAVLAENGFYARRVRSIESALLSRFFAKDADLPAELSKYFAEFDLIITYLFDPDLIFETNLRRSGAQKIVRGPAKIENSSHASRQLAQPINELGLSISDFAPRLYPSSEDRHRAREFLAELAAPIIAFHPGSGSDRKNWPLQNWIELGNHVLGNFAASLVIVSGEADEDQIRQVESIWQNPRVRFAKHLLLPDLAAALENTIFVGHDSGISHLAAAAGANCILLFGPTDPAVWAPPNEDVLVIRAPNGNLRRLDVDLVRGALDQELMRIGIST
ncbi:MAG TPA: glycosyltransferase family 9 protein [Chthoniobacterales bacterium]|nr:glycosyltransferase family 9 protein [Chthoniobacterales bacterium]